jgi:c(7)-type cytochrome triheme protein
MRWCIYICLLALSVSCSPQAGKEHVEKPQERVISRDEAMGELPCFKCHSYQKFASPGKGAFPHSIHMKTGYHCNQCHRFEAHRFMKTDTSACNTCHNIKTFTYSSGGFPAKFNHESHAKLGCRECHSGIFPMKKGGSRITMDAMYQGRYCGACHDGKKAFSSSDCGKCHAMKGFNKAITFKVESVGNVTFSHEFHSGIFTCDNCHPKVFEMKRKKMTMDAMYNGKYCGSCHNGEKGFPSTDCGKCHAK